MYDSQTEENNFVTVSSSQKLSEMRYQKFHVMELREKWVSFYDVN